MSRFKKAITYSVLCTLYFAVLNGCGMEDHMREVDRHTERMAKEMEGYRDYVKALTEAMQMFSADFKSLNLQAQVIAAFMLRIEQLSTPLFLAMKEALLTEKPAGPTKDIDDVLNGDAGNKGTDHL